MLNRFKKVSKRFLSLSVIMSILVTALGISPQFELSPTVSASVDEFEFLEKIMPEDLEEEDRFGHSTAMNEQYFVVGSEKMELYFYDYIDGEWVLNEIIDPEPSEDNCLGEIALDENFLVFGDTCDSTIIENGGAVFIYERIDDSWVQIQKVYPSESIEGDQFGHSVDISGDFFVVGINESLPDPHQGSAFVFKNNLGTWEEYQILQASDGVDEDRFGFSVAIHDEFIVVGDFFNYDTIRYQGAAYLYKIIGDDWIETNKVTLDWPEYYDWFGYEVDISNDYIAISTIYRDGAYFDQGEVNIYTLRGGIAYDQTLTSPSAQISMHFGKSLRLYEDALLVGAPNYDDGETNTGISYLYLRNETEWVLDQTFENPAPEAEDIFGNSLAMNSNYITIAESQDNEAGTNTGSIHRYRLPLNLTPVAHEDVALTNQNEPVEIPVLLNDHDKNGDVLSVLFAADGDHGLVEHDGETITYTPDLDFVGDDVFSYTVSDGFGKISDTEVHVKVYEDKAPLLSSQKLTAFNAKPVESFGREIEVYGDYAVIPTKNKNVEYDYEGAVYIYKRETGVWRLFDYLTSFEPNENGNFGKEVMISGNKMFISQNNVERTGVVYIYEITDDGVVYRDSITASDAIVSSDFGRHIKHSDEYLLITDGGYSYDNEQKIYLFEEDLLTGEWDEVENYSLEGFYGGYSDIEIEGRSIVVGSSSDIEGAGTNTGAIYSYVINESNEIHEVDKIFASEPQDYAYFGGKIDIEGDLMAVTAHGQDEVDDSSGVVYLFERIADGDEEFWIESDRVYPEDTHGNQHFGAHNAKLNDGRLYVTASNDDDFGIYSGAVYIFKQNDIGRWEEEKKILLPGGEAYDRFGTEAKIFDTTLFTSRDSDTEFGTNSGAVYTFELDLEEPNTPPVAEDDFVVMLDELFVDIDVLTNDSDADGDVLTISEYTEATHGSLEQDGDNFIYTPDADYYGEDSFTYTVTDGVDFDTATVFITVEEPPNTPPLAVDDFVEVEEGVLIEIDVLANDSDADGDPLAITEYTEVSNGVLEFDGERFEYTADLGFAGLDTFTYTITDGIDFDSATVNITVTERPNLAPTAVDDEFDVLENSVTELFPLENDTDPDGDPLIITTAIDGAFGTVEFTESSVTYTPNPDFVGTDLFVYSISDGRGGADTALVTVNVLVDNAAPIALDDVAATEEETPVDIAVLENDRDPDGDPISIIEVGAALHGTVVNNSSHLTYTPDPGFFGEDSFDYTITDPSGAESTARVSVLVEGERIISIPEALKVTASDGASEDKFGEAVDIDGNFAVVGSAFSDELGESAGAAYVYENRDGVWTEIQKLLGSDTEIGDFFGTDVAISGDRIIVGAYSEDTEGLHAGAAYIFERELDGTWLETQKIVSADTRLGDNFGRAVEIEGDRVVVGAPYANRTAGVDQGTAYVFEHNGFAWVETSLLQPADIMAGV